MKEALSDGDGRVVGWAGLVAHSFSECMYVRTYGCVYLFNWYLNTLFCTYGYIYSIFCIHMGTYTYSMNPVQKFQGSFQITKTH